MEPVNDIKPDNDNAAAPAGKKPSRPVRKILKAIVWTVVSLLLLVIIALTALVLIMNPDRLTPLVSRYASEYLDAEVKVERVELTFWSSFPRLKLDVDNLEVISRSLDSAPDSVRAQLPVYADSLLTVGRLSGGVDLAWLAAGNIKLYDLLIDSPRVNVVIAGDAGNNFSIVPAGDEDEDKEDSPMNLPDIAVDRFRIVNAVPLRFFSLADSLEAEIEVATIDLNGEAAPLYRLSVDGGMSSPLLSKLSRSSLTVGLDGKIEWLCERPLSLRVSDVVVSCDSLAVSMNGDFDFADGVVVNAFDAEFRDVALARLLSYMPDNMARGFRTMRTDISFSGRAELTRPYTLTDSVRLPSLNARLEIPDSYFYFKDARFDRLSALVEAEVNGDFPDSSVVSLRHLEIDGKAVDVSLSGTARSLFSDPAVDARFSGDLTIDRLPRRLLDRLPVEVEGRLSGNAGVKMRLSDLHPERFHRMNLSGNVGLSRFVMTGSDSTSVFVNRADLKFGTTGMLVANSVRVDSMLTVSLSVDTASVDIDGMAVRLRDMKAGVGTLNRNSSADTTSINPFGGSVTVGRLSLDSRPDSLSLRMRDADIRGSLRRFRGQGRVPLLSLDAGAELIGMRDPAMRVVLRKPSFDVTAHVRTRRQFSDSLRRRAAAISAADTLDTRREGVIEIDSGLKALLRRWDVSGTLASERVGLFMTAFPLRQRVDSLLMSFSTDSVVLSRLHYTIGNSEMDVTGEVTGIRRALSSRRRRAKLNAALDVHASYIDVNQLSRAAFSDVREADDADIVDGDSELFGDMETAGTDTLTPRPVLIPGNVAAHVHLCASRMLYADLNLHDFTGEIVVDNSAVNLRNLSAMTDIGDISLTALYSAPDTTSMQFGMGMKINNFHIDKMMSLIPAVDSLLPVMRDFSGVINADLAATSAIRPDMNFDIPSLKAALKLEGDSLVLLDADTFKSLSKWLMFKNKKHNMIDRMSVEIVVEDSQVELFPFMFDIDRYRLGVMGHNDMAMNLDYHVSVLKSPLPFKFGINVKGNVDNLKIRLGGARFKENMAYDRVAIADTTRVSLLRQIESVFRRSAGTPPRLSLDTSGNPHLTDGVTADTISGADSLLMIQHGFIEVDSTAVAAPVEKDKKVKNRKNKKK